MNPKQQLPTASLGNEAGVLASVFTLEQNFLLYSFITYFLGECSVPVTVPLLRIHEREGEGGKQIKMSCFFFTQLLKTCIGKMGTSYWESVPRLIA